VRFSSEVHEKRWRFPPRKLEMIEKCLPVRREVSVIQAAKQSWIFLPHGRPKEIMPA
jgi:hypothetical protein